MVTKSAPERFWAKVHRTETCWLWTGAEKSDGYGNFRVDSARTIGAHRWAWEHLVGAIPDGLVLIHECGNHACVNPDHLRLGDRRPGRHLDEELFWSRTRQDGDCLIWTGARDKRGDYGWYSGHQAHRLAYVLTKGEIPTGLQIDHLCGRTLCVNSNHMEPVTQLENMRRRNALYTHCKHGHEYTEANAGRYSGGGRFCRQCAIRRSRAYRAKKRAARYTPEASA